MPLESHVPKIDDRRFEDIVREIRSRIPRYTPEWTDLNDSDPGMAMLQVFAWLTEMMLYRLGRVPELNYIKFLQLVGIELSPAEPATAEITFPVLETQPQPTLIVPLHTQVTAAAAAGEAPIIFETDRALTALRARLAATQAFDGFAFTDVTAENDEPQAGFLPFGPLAPADSALYLGFSDPEDFPQVQLDLAFFAFEDPVGPAAFDCGLPATQAFPSAALSWEYWNGKDWLSLNLLKDETRALSRSGHVLLRTPAKGSLQRAAVGTVTESLFWIRVRVLSSAYERAPRLLAVRTNTVPATQAETFRDEVLGGSDGSPNQVFALDNTPVLADTLLLEVDEGEGFIAWEPVPDFFGSGSQDRHYVLNRTTGEVRFGDGVNGRIPVANLDNPGGNVVAREYRAGGGQRGNVPAGALSALLTAVSGVDEGGMGNLQAAVGGRDEETLEAAKLRAPRSLKSRCRAVTAEDFETLAMAAANIRRAKALPLVHPDFPGVKVPGVMTVIVVPDTEAPNPMPSEGTLRTVCAYLNERRLLTTELYVTRPTYQRVEVRGSVIAENSADLAEVKEAIEASLLTYFHPLVGGENGQGWPFGGDIFFSQVYQRVLLVPGVQRIEQLVILVDDDEVPVCQDVTVPEGVLLYSTGHPEVQVSYAFEE